MFRSLCVALFLFACVNPATASPPGVDTSQSSQVDRLGLDLGAVASQVDRLGLDLGAVASQVDRLDLDAVASPSSQSLSQAPAWRYWRETRTGLPEDRRTARETRHALQPNLGAYRESRGDTPRARVTLRV